jgi:hypothetical protein
LRQVIFAQRSATISLILECGRCILSVFGGGGNHPDELKSIKLLFLK